MGKKIGSIPGNPVLESAIELTRRGRYVVSIPRGSKKPQAAGWQKRKLHESSLASVFTDPNGNIGLMPGLSGLVDVDLDCDEARKLAPLFLPKTGMVHGRASAPKSHWWYEATLPKPLKFTDPDGNCLLELRSNGQQTLVPPSIHPSGESILWDSNTDAALFDGLAKSASQIAAGSLLLRNYPANGARHDTAMAFAGWALRAGWSVEETVHFLEAVSTEAGDERAGQRRHDVESTAARIAEGKEVTGLPKLAELIGEPVAKKLASFFKADTARDIVTIALNSSPASLSIADAPNLLKEFTNDLGNARRIISCFGSNIKYCYSFNGWLVWDEVRWVEDKGNGQVRGLVHRAFTEYMRQAYSANNKEHTHFAVQSLDAKRISNALREAQVYLGVEPSELNTNPWLLNFKNGTLDISTGYFREHRKTDLLTKVVHHDLNPKAVCPRFLKFLEHTVGPDLVPFLQKILGYSMTGTTREKIAFLLYGVTDSGKTTLLNLMRELFSDFSVLVRVESLMLSPRGLDNNAQSDLANLAGARFAVTSETEEGMKLNESNLKRIVQGQGKISAVRKYENVFSFDESHKIWIDSNHRPVIRGVDDAIWNRLCIVPCPNRLPQNQIDRNLPNKLRAEAEGVIAWVVEGALRYYAEGVRPLPNAVEAVSEEWRVELDDLGQFISECTLEGGQIGATDLYGLYRTWAEKRGGQILTAAIFGSRLAEKFPRRHIESGNVYVGIHARPVQFGKPGIYS